MAKRRNRDMPLLIPDAGVGFARLFQDTCHVTLKHELSVQLCRSGNLFSVPFPAMCASENAQHLLLFGPLGAYCEHNGLKVPAFSALRLNLFTTKVIEQAPNFESR